MAEILGFNTSTKLELKIKITVITLNVTSYCEIQSKPQKTGGNSIKKRVNQF